MQRRAATRRLHAAVRYRKYRTGSGACRCMPLKPYRDRPCYTLGALSMIVSLVSCPLPYALFGKIHIMMPSEHGRDPGAAPLLLVGREREWTALHDHVAAARAGQGSLILISGEAGIGKTALAEALCDAVARQGALVLIGRCYDLTETPPYGPWLELFAQYQSADATPLGSTPRLPAAFARRGSIGTATSQAALFDQVRDFFATVAASRPAGTRPLLILLDDLHWADPASLDLLRFLARALTTVPLLLVATYRADELTRRHPLYALVPLLVREAAAVRLDLRRLHPDAIRTLVERRYHLAEADATRLVAYLDTRAEGNPLFLSELLRALEEEGTLDRTADGWVVGDLDRRSVPLLLRQVIDGRVARLGEEAQRLLGVAAVIGQEVPLPLWATVANAEEETLLTVVERAGDAHLLEEAADGIGVRFTHALIREALYAGLSPARRRIVHQRAGEALVALPSPDPDAVAAHFQQAGDARTAEWLVRAGERAQRAYAWLSAADRYETALAMRDACGADAAERGWLHYRLAMLRRYMTNARGRAHLEAAAACAAEAADRMLAAHVQYYRGLLHCFAGNVREGLPEIEASLAALEALPVGERSPHAPSEALIDTSTGRGSLASWLAQVGRFAEVCAIGEAFVARYDPHGTGEDAPLALMPAYHGLGPCIRASRTR